MSTMHNPVLDEMVEDTPVNAEDGRPAAGKMIIRVRRGALRRFDHLKTKSADLPVEIKWDRRASDRRGTAAEADEDRRRAERRQAPPFTWDTADFVVVGEPDTPVAAKADPSSDITDRG
jgi:hypothetical protein